MPKLEVVGLEKRYLLEEGDELRELVALQDVSFTVAEREFVSIVGPSGCGKTTLLMIVAGLAERSGGEVRLDGRPVEGPGLDRGVVFQEFALFPWMTVLENVCFGLEMKGVPRGQRLEVARRFLAMVGLQGFERVYPHRLSGGMKQRVAVARALAYDPEVLLMDEPFGALDAQTRAVLQQMLVDVWAQTRKTVLFVTHSIREALLLSDRVLVMSARPGRIVGELPVALPRPRDPLSPEFAALQRALAEMLGGVPVGLV